MTPRFNGNGKLPSNCASLDPTWFRDFWLGTGPAHPYDVIFIKTAGSVERHDALVPEFLATVETVTEVHDAESSPPVD